MNTNYSIRCWLDGLNKYQTQFKNIGNALFAYESISSTMEFDRVQLVRCVGSHETIISATTRDEEIYNSIMS